MGESDAALLLMRKADEGLQALGNMLDPASFSNAIFGFHAQQAVEKATKAWLIVAGWDPPNSHDLRSLFMELEQRCGVDAVQLRLLLELNAYAVRWRYGDDSTGPVLNRLAVLGKVVAFTALARAAVVGVQTE